MAYTEVLVEVARGDAERLSDALLDLGALSVSVEDADADTTDEQPLYGEPGLTPQANAWHRSRVIALIGDDQDGALLLAAAANAAGLPGTPAPITRAVPEQDWVRATQAQFEPIRIGERIWVVPSWHDAPDPSAIVLELDPGLAFGTGSHPTTRLCMQWLEQHVTAGATVLDYGCGSGILAILAKKCGAGRVTGIDIDPLAVDAARRNGTRNRVEVEFGLPDDRPIATFDRVVANILSNPLKLMASMLCAKVAPGGALALSGVLARQADEVIAAYAEWLPLRVWAEAEGWVCLTGRRETGIQHTRSI